MGTPTEAGDAPGRDWRDWGVVITVGALGAMDAALLAYGIAVIS
ncbi:hypothetical protein [Microbacterium sp. KR10-403]